MCRYEQLGHMLINSVQFKHKRIECLLNKDREMFHRCKEIYVIVGFNTATVCRGSVLAQLRQYWPEGFSPRANASESVPIRARNIPWSCCNLLLFYLFSADFKHSKTKIALTERGDYKYSSFKFYLIIAYYIHVIKIYKLKRCSKKEYCKQCRYVKFKDTMPKY